MNSVPRQTSDFGADTPSGERPVASRAEEVGAINTRLTEIARQIEYLSRTTAAAPPDHDTRETLSHAIGRIDARLDQLAQGIRMPAQERYTPNMPSIAQAFARLGAERLNAAYVPGQEPAEIDRATAEIAARQRALDGEFGPAYPPRSPSSLEYYVPRREAAALRHEPPRNEQPGHDPVRQESPPPPPAAAPPAVPQIDLSGIERQIRKLTEQLETFNRPCRADDMLKPLRQELSEIGQRIAEALPRRAIETLEAEVHGLAARLDVSRQTGIEADAIVGVERGLAEVREALLRLTPAESLVGFDHAVTTLTQKVDMLASRQDPAAMEQLESSIAALRGIVGNVASSESLATLAGEVRALAEKFERGMPDSSPDLLIRLEQRVAAIAEAVEVVRADGQRVVPAGLDRLIASLNDKIESLIANRAPLSELASGDRVAVDRLEDRITQLVEKLDESQARLGHLGAIERGMAELLVHLDELRTHSDGRGLRAGDSGGLPFDSLSRDLAELKLSQSEVKRLAQDSLEAVQGTIGDVVGRLAMIEADMHGLGRNAAAPPAAFDPPPPSADPAIAKVKPLDLMVEPRLVDPAVDDSGNAAKAPPPRLTRAPIETGLPPDYPLEPGSGPPRVRVPSSPADRIAASEAPLRAAMAAPAQPASKSDYLQAARGAAKTALNAKRAEPGPAASASASKFSKALRRMFVGLSIIVLLAAALRYAVGYLEVAELPVPQPSALAELTAPQVSPMAQAPVVAAQPADLTAALSMPALVPPAPAFVPMPAPAQTAPAAEFTGTVPVHRSPAEPAAAATMPPSQSALPAAIGGQRLIGAANGGDPAAAYEIAMRYAEGKGVARDPAQAVVWFERAAKAGLAPAQFRLGTLYEKGNGVAKDLQEARRQYLAAADKGNAHAMHNMAVLYAEGIDGKPDYRIAVQWFRKAAQHGIADSQYNLAVLYARGIGIEQNLAEAFKWFALAARSGDSEAAKKRDDVAGRLDKQTLAAARQAVDGWNAEREPDGAATVNAPDGGWDQAIATPTRVKSRPRGQTTKAAALQ